MTKSFFMETSIIIARYKKITIALAIFICLITAPGFSQVNENSKATAKKGYAPVNGLKMYYEVYGSGKPLVLLHGAFNTINMAFGMLIPELSKNRQVIALELQGHGRTGDIDRPFHLNPWRMM